MLQDLREEGEIDSDDGGDEVESASDAEENGGGDVEQVGHKPAAASEAVPAAEAEAHVGGGTNTTERRGNSARARGRGSKKIFTNSRSLVQASAQAQRGPIRQRMLLPEVLMSSIFA